jgi:hypothetical protein
MGVPAVVIATEQFEKLARVIMKSQHVPESVMILIRGNPEFIAQNELEQVADRVLEEAVGKLTRTHAAAPSRPCAEN